ncbi:MAG: type II secretion system F family protein [Candidatus Riflebacteria bacterium]|nr:type II secretion system F family protein [Candidatus Riflebacteria bacterium]
MTNTILNSEIQKPVIAEKMTNQEELIAFCRLIVAASKSGMKLIPALDKITNNNYNKQSIIWIRDLVDKLKKGYSIEEAKDSLKGLDPVLGRLLPLLGNEKLIRVFEIYTKYLIKQETCNKQIRCLVWYPLLVMLFAFGFVLYLNFHSFPLMVSMSSLETTLDGLGIRLLYFANASLWPFSLMIPGLMLYLIADCAIYMIFGRFIKTSLWAKISGLDKADEMNEKARLAALLSIYVEAGYSLNEALDASISFVGEEQARELLKVNQSFKAGNNLSEVLINSGVLSDFLNGKESVDELPAKLNYAYDNFNYETINLIKSISDKLFYIPLIIAGLMVMLVVTGFFGSYSNFAWSIL